ncbi:HAD-IA family hydrolase [Sutterella sp.]|uniref:HAD-IA family hydrolase n=1 Tax=Sutterella sp. TaxID=1981025 RepID=UPI0026E0533B|nr:HAD-IA family hydrolase [Sutterella sp.]MDO5532122.1 HAD-IA family hydrolase [Sutterella sp.]
MPSRRPEFLGRRGSADTCMETARRGSPGDASVPFLRFSARPRLWLFDLDDTLIASSRGLLDEVHDLMNEFLMHRMGMTEAEANHWRSWYWEHYGSTFIGLWRCHGVDPRVFLPAVHDFDYTPYLNGLHSPRRLLEKFPGKRAVVTNGPRVYAEKLLTALGLDGFFDAVVTSTDMRLFGDWRPKPSVSMLRAICADLGSRPGDAVLIDDSLMNLRAAKRAGMRTVWCTGLRRRHAGLRTRTGAPMPTLAADMIVRDITELLRRI